MFASTYWPFTWLLSSVMLIMGRLYFLVTVIFGGVTRSSNFEGLRSLLGGEKEIPAQGKTGEGGGIT